MRKVTEKTVTAFLNHERASCGNTFTDGEVLELHGNPIARHVPEGRIQFTLAGWNTPTTRDRINGLLDMIGADRVYQRDFKAYWQGELIGEYEWYFVSEVL